MDAGDRRARFDAAVAPHLNEALTLAHWLMRNRADAEDVLQDACVRAFRSIDRLSGPNARAWLFMIVRNTAYSMLARKKTSAVVPIEELPQHRDEIERGEQLMAHHDVTPEAEVIARADAKALQAAVNALAPEFRETLVLREIQQMSYQEIAHVTGAPVGTVMSRLARARQKLVAEIKERA